MNNQLIALKIKIKALAAESKIIRHEELKIKSGPVEERHRIAYFAEHRKLVVRKAARETHLAYGYLRGREYHQIEKSCKIEPSWALIAKMVCKYGKSGMTDEDLKDWAKDPAFALKKAA